MLELDVAENPFREELTTRPFRIDANGRIAVPTGPGLGIERSTLEEAIRQIPCGSEWPRGGYFASSGVFNVGGSAS